MQPLARTLICCAVGLTAALAGLESTNPEPTLESLLRTHPVGTRGCPGLERQMRAWQESLWLEEWEVEIHCGFPPNRAHEDDLLGSVWRYPDQRRATIWIREGFSPLFQQSVIVHELVHVVVGAGRWPVPDGRDEEEFVEQAGEEFFRSRRRAMQVDLMRRAQREALAKRAPVIDAGESGLAAYRAPLPLQEASAGR